MTNNDDARIILAVAAEGNDGDIWDMLNAIQTKMFAAGRVSIKLAYFARELTSTSPNRPFVATRWATDPHDLADLLEHARGRCICGCFCQLSDLFTAALEESRQAPVQALIILCDQFHGDVNTALAQARKLAARGVRLFLFVQEHSPHDAHARDEEVFRALAEQTGGVLYAYNPHIERVAQRLPGLLEATALFAIGGKSALAALGNEPAALLLDQMIVGRPEA